MQNWSSSKKFLTQFSARYFNSAGHQHHIFYCSFWSAFAVLGQHIFTSYLGRLPFFYSEKARICLETNFCGTTRWKLARKGETWNDSTNDSKFHKLASMKGFWNSFQYKLLPLTYWHFFSLWENIIRCKWTFYFFCTIFFAPLSWQKNSNRKHRNDRKCHTLIILVNASIQMHQQGVSWMDQRNFHSGSVSLYGSSTFETLTHRVLLIVSETLILASPRANAKQQRFI